MRGFPYDDRFPSTADGPNTDGRGAVMADMMDGQPAIPS
jgi:hypothetical protein